MLKLLLAAVLFSACVGSAYWLTLRYRKRRDFFYNLWLFHERLINEVSYTRIPLTKFTEKYEFSGDFQRLLADKRGDFRGGKCNIGYLTEEENKFLCDYFGMIGGSDAKSQQAYLSALRGEIEERRSNGENIYKKYFALYLKLGVLAGLVLVILVV